MADAAHLCSLTQGSVAAVPQQLGEQGSRVHGAAGSTAACADTHLVPCQWPGLASELSEQLMQLPNHHPASAQTAHFCDNLRLQQHNKGEIYPDNVCLISAELMAHEMCWLVLCRPGI